MNNDLSAPQDDLIIRFKRQIYYQEEGVYHAQVIRSPIPIQGGEFRTDIEMQLRKFQKLFEDQLWVARFYPYENPPKGNDALLEESRQGLVALGEALAEMLPISLRGELLRTLQVVYVQGKGLRLVLEVEAGDKADQLLHLPWELLFFVSTGQFPARTPRFLVVRRLLGAPLYSPAKLARPLNLIHVISSGQGDNRIGEELQEMERIVLPQVTGDGKYKLVANPGSIERVRQAQAELPSTVLHFLGHGLPELLDVDGTPVRSYLIFTAEDGASQYVTGEQLRQILGEASTLQMIVLPACYTGTAATGNIAYDLVMGGFPYVVAMQSAMPQPALRHFLPRFYRELQQGESPEYAVAAGRHEIATNLPGSLDWCLPVFYTSAGVVEPGPLPRLIEWINSLFSPAFFQRMWILSLLFGLLHGWVGLLLGLSSTTLAAPDGMFLLQALGWLMLAPPLLTFIVYRYGALPLPDALTPSARMALLLRLLAAASMGVGFVTLYMGYFSVALLAGLGFWSLLSSPAQWLALLPISILALLFGVAQTHSHGLGFITSDSVRSIPLDGSDTIIIVAGYIMLLAPLLLLLVIPQWLAPPWLNGFVGIINIAVAFMLAKSDDRHFGREKSV